VSCIDVRDTVRVTALLLLFAALATPATRPEQYVVLLEEPPLAARVVDRKQLGQSAATDRRQALIARQNSLAASFTRSGARVIGSSQVLVNALFIQASPEQADQIAAQPGVRFVERVAPMKRHLMRALDLGNVPQAWSVVNGSQNAGAGVKIAIIDTGIDHTHPGFADDGLQYPSGFPKCQEARGDCAFVNRKVIAARSYVDMLVGDDPQFSRPDDTSPRDRVGHGTAVAMVAAGVRNTGPLGAITGVAPRAWVGNYKIFGSPGVNGQFTTAAAVVQALTDALSDGMDIAVLSLGSPAVWGPRDRGATCNMEGTDACDWRAEATENAARMGLTVVISAGNAGEAAIEVPAYSSVESPGTAPAAITVGAITNSHILYQSVRVEGPNVPADISRINTYFGDGPRPGSPVTAPLRDVAQLEDNGLACSPLANGSLGGAIALIQRGECQLLIKINHAQRAGAVGAIIYQTDGVQGVFPMRGLEETGIPAVLIGNRAGTALKNYASQTAEARVTLDPAVFAQNAEADANIAAFFSSRGPSIRETGIKPELVAVGTDLYTATQRFDPNGDLYDATGYAAVQGTSFAAPMVAGAAAIVKQRNPGFTPGQIKSALVNTASDRVFDFDSQNRLVGATVLDMGAGKLNAADAVRTSVTVEPATLAFGAYGDGAPPPRELVFRNHGSESVRLQLAVVPSPVVSSSARVILDATTLNIAAGGSARVTARLEGSRPQPEFYDGAVQVSGGPVPLRIPYLYFVADGTPYNILPLQGDGFVGDVGGRTRLALKVIDRVGLPVRNAPVRFQSTVGGGVVIEELQNTDDLGISDALIQIGGQIGEQEFYAAVGNNNNFGIYFGGRARLIPTIASGGVRNAASGLLGQGVAPGSYISIFGRGLAEVTRSYNTPYLPLSLAGVSVSFDVPSRRLSVPGRIHFVSDGQINVQVPWELQGVSTALMKVSIGDSSSELFSLAIADHGPAVFEYTETGSGRLLAAAVSQAGTVIGTANAAAKGGVVQLYVNGLGPVNNQPASGEAASLETLSPTRSTPVVTIGGRPADVIFSGLAPGYVGLYQLNVRVGADAPSGLQPVVVTVNGIASKAATLPVQ
jgi:uncharacterized protein (TIGR03437 family)